MGVKNKKITFFDFLPYECDAAEVYLEEMAEKGWLLQSIYGAFLKFKKIEPCKIKYTVDVHQRISELDCNDSNIALEYREYYSAAGWNYVCQKGKIQVFYTEDYGNTIPIQSQEEKFKSGFKASLNRILSSLVFILVFILNLSMQLFIGSVDLTLASNIGVLSVLSMASIVFINIILILSFFIWFIKAWVLLRKGEFKACNNSRHVRRKNIFTSLFATLLLVLLFQFLIFYKHESQILGISIFFVMLAIGVISMLVRKFINKKRYSNKTKLAIYTVSIIVSVILVMSVVSATVFKNITYLEQSKVTTENKALTFMDFGQYQNDNEDVYTSIDKSILAKRIDYSWGNNTGFKSI
ncbi:DUF2812 domain-containing protein [Candidatus Clostridium stratigraminis]|uniref:DUF2812 domain-containing protein n=1 Tax=Candidatus Clostridium stratigraminis TaxID=3381661 RepID=A0ABW8T869_9CLOT